MRPKKGLMRDVYDILEMHGELTATAARKVLSQYGVRASHNKVVSSLDNLIHRKLVERNKKRVGGINHYHLAINSKNHKEPYDLRESFQKSVYEIIAQHPVTRSEIRESVTKLGIIKSEQQLRDTLRSLRDKNLIVAPKVQGGYWHIPEHDEPIFRFDPIDDSFSLPQIKKPKGKSFYAALALAITITAVAAISSVITTIILESL